MKISDAIRFAARELAKADVADPRREAASLLTFVLQKNSAFQIAHPEYALNKTESAAFRSVIRRRAGREPFHYITGSKEFYGLEFEVIPGVLIPRPETEILVKEAIGLLCPIKDPRFLEIGVGSGCISIAILHSVLFSNGVGTDISETALKVTEKNAVMHNVADRLTLQKSNLFKGVTGAFNLIVSNPPYIPESDLESLQTEVGQFEPHSALFGGPDGLAIVRPIIRDAPQFMNPGAFLLIEIGFGQSVGVKEMFDKEIWESVEFLPDFQGIPRIAKARSRL